jgi:6,7-dimethyl-8-ribityllumazine synthase
MKEKRVNPAPACLHAGAVWPCALILATTLFKRTSMNQMTPTPLHPAGTTRPFAPPPRVALISAGWHREIVLAGVTAMRAEFERCRVPPDQLLHVQVPGAFEIPLHAMRLARSGRVDAVIACALVVNGGIYRHEFVAAAVIDGLMRVQLDTDVPVFSAVLTPHDFHEHEVHQRFFREHFVTKGTEAAQACLQTLASLRQLSPPALADG